MKKEEVMVYNSDLGIDGTIPQLTDWCVRYCCDYSDDALDEISRRAKELGFDRDTLRIPLLVKADRTREKEEPDTIPYERLQLCRILGSRVSYSETKDYGELEISEENGRILISVIGMDSEGCFSAVGAYNLDEFMNGTGNWLEQAIGSVLYYSKVYTELE